MSRPMFDDLVSLEPRLADLLKEAQGYRRKARRRFCANAVWYGYRGHAPGLKQQLSELVGWYSGRKDLLGTPGAYDVAYQTLYYALPDCRHEGECGPYPADQEKQEAPVTVSRSN